MRSRGHTVIVAGFYDKAASSLSIKEEKGIIVYRLRHCKPPLGTLRSRLNLYRLIKKIIKSHSINVLEAPDYLGLLALWPRLPVPIVVRIHGGQTYFSSELGQQIRRRSYFYERSTLKKATSLISVSNYALEKTKSIFNLKSPISTIYNSVELPPRESISGKKCFSGKVVFSGTLMKKKGVFTLIEAWPEVIKKNPQARLHMFGKDSIDENGTSVKSLLLQKLSPQYRDTVIFHGHVNNRQILNELLTASAAVFPSISETFGLAPVEAMAQGCPTIFTKLASGPEIINNGVNGILVDPFNPKEIAEAIIRILADKNLAQKIGFEGRKSVENRFSNDVILQQNEKMYQKVIAEFNSTRWKKPLIQKGLYKIDLPHD